MRRAHLDAQVDLLKPLGELVEVNGAVVVGVDDGHQPLDLRDAQTSLELLRGAVVSTCMRSRANPSHSAIITPCRSAIITPWHSAILMPWHSSDPSQRSSHLHALDELGGIDLPIAIRIEQVEELP